MKFAYYLLLIALLGCHTSDEHTVGPERIENAFIYDTSQFADGCELYIQLDSGSSPAAGLRYKPSPATLPLAQRVVTKLALRKDPYIPIRIRFTETTNQVIIHCGWVNATATEIKILEIMSR